MIKTETGEAIRVGGRGGKEIFKKNVMRSKPTSSKGY